MADYGIKVSEPGVNVESALKNQLYLQSQYALLKILGSGSGSVSYNAGSINALDVLIYTHNLGYQPLFNLYAQYVDGFSDTFITDFVRMPVTEWSSGGLLYNNYFGYTNTTELRFNLANSGGSGTWTINYFYVVYYDQQ